MNLAAKLFAAVQGVTCGSSGTNAVNLPNCGGDVTQNTVATALSIVSEVAGAVCLLIIVLGGFRYVTSAGNPEGIKRAKDTIIYAAIGLIVSISAYVIVGFVLGKL